MDMLHYRRNLLLLWLSIVLLSSKKWITWIHVTAFTPATFFRNAPFVRRSLLFVQQSKLQSRLGSKITAALGSTSDAEDTNALVDGIATTIPATTVISINSPIRKIRRQYETFLWTRRSDNNNNNQLLQQQQEPTYRINYRVEGPLDGRPILLVHGFGANINHYRFQYPALVEAGYRVYGIDLLGFGASDKPTENVDYSVELFAELLQDFVDYIDQQRHQAPVITTDDDDNNQVATDKQGYRRRHEWVVAGNSIGGLLSLALAQRIPEKVGGVVLFNCSGGLSAFRYSDFSNNLLLLLVLWVVQLLLRYTPLGANFYRDFKTRENVESILTQQGVYRDSTNVNEELLEILLEPSNDEGAQHVFLKVFVGPAGPTPESILPEIQCPILALWGEADPWTPIDFGMHPGSRFGEYTQCPYHLVRLPGVGHCPHDEVPDMVNFKMIQWMDEELLPMTLESTTVPTLTNNDNDEAES